MNIHEYQAKALLKRYGVVVPRGGVAFSPAEAEKVANELGGPVWVVSLRSTRAAEAPAVSRTIPKGKAASASSSRSPTWRPMPAKCWARCL